MIPYGHQSISEEDIQAVINSLTSEWLTTGPKVNEFEDKIKEFTGAKYGIAVSSGTAALHCVMYALDIKPGDEVIVPPMTFAATSNSIIYQGGTPVFVDVEDSNLLIDVNKIETKITDKTRAVIGVDYAGHPCEWDELKALGKKYNIAVISDACHSLGAEYKEKKVGTLADMTVLSFHPVKHITTGEGGMILTDSEEYFKRICLFRNHGITKDSKKRVEEGTWFYEMTDLGYNYRLSDIQCALGINQLKRLPDFLKQRHEIVSKYNAAFIGLPGLDILECKKYVKHAYHLYVIRVNSKSKLNRDQVYEKLRNNNIGINVHYIPVHLHPYYRKKFGFKHGDFPVAENAYKQILSLPIWPGLEQTDVDYVIEKVKECFK